MSSIANKHQILVSIKDTVKDSLKDYFLHKFKLNQKIKNQANKYIL